MQDERQLWLFKDLPRKVGRCLRTALRPPQVPRDAFRGVAAEGRRALDPRSHICGPVPRPCWRLSWTMENGKWPAC